MFVYGVNGFFNKFCRLKVYLIIGLDIDTFPQFLKLLLLKP